MKLTRRSVMQGTVALSAAAALSPLEARRAKAAAPQIVYWGHNYPSRVRLVNEIMGPGFKKETGIEVVHNDFETNQNETKILTGWTGGQGGPDLVSVGDNNLPNYVYRKLVAPVDPGAFGFKTQDELLAAYEPGVLDGFVVDGKLYAIPMDLASISLYYRRDFFKEAGLDPDKPPQTWEDVIEAGKLLVKKDKNGTITRAGLGWEARSISSHFYYWGTLLPQKGVDFLSKDGTKAGFDNAAGMEAFQFLWDTFQGSKISALGLAPVISPIDDFGSGLAAMMNSGSWLAPSMEAKYPNVSYKDGVFGVTRLPQFRAGTKATRLNPWVWMVGANSSVQKEAWQFVAYMTQRPENRALWFKEAQYVQPWKGFQALPEVKAIPYMNTFLE
ncbi:MAG: extracellular solute-binding protein, partial [Hyphomicrobiales bacterium]